MRTDYCFPKDYLTCAGVSGDTPLNGDDKINSY